VGPPRVWLCASCGEAAPPWVASFIAAVGGCCSRAVSPARGDAPPPCVAWFMAAVGGCCGFADSAAAADAAVLLSAAPMADVGGCCPVVVPAAPTVGPDPASRDANSLVTFSISVVHGPAAAVPSGKATTAQAASSNVIVFMRFSPNGRNSELAKSTSLANGRSVPTKQRKASTWRAGRSLSCIFLFFSQPRHPPRAASSRERRALRGNAHCARARLLRPNPLQFLFV